MRPGSRAAQARSRAANARSISALRNRPGVILKARSYPGENHLSYYPNLLIDGFRFVLPPTVPVDLPFVALPAGTIARYAGVYDLPDGRTITLSAARDSMLSAQVTGAPSVLLLPNGPDRYYAYTSDLDVRFDKTSLTLSGGGRAKLRVERGKTP